MPKENGEPMENTVQERLLSSLKKEYMYLDRKHVPTIIQLDSQKKNVIL